VLSGYGDAPVDEVGLASRAEPFVSRLHGRLPNVFELRQLTREHGVNVATMVFYRAILSSPAHGPFARTIDAVATEPRRSSAALTLLVVPAMFYRERPDLGGDGQLAASIAAACGFRTKIVATRSRGTLSENARAIADAIAGEEDDVWLFSLSKGGGEVRLALQRDTHADARRRVRGWINVSGIVRGSHFIDEMLATSARRLRARAFCIALGTSYSGVRELTTTHPFWQQRFEAPADMRIINVVGVPLCSHIQKGLVGRYRRLAVLGPNDGFVLLPETLITPGAIYPIWGSDHLFRSPQVSPLLYRLFNYVLCGVEDRRREYDTASAPCPTP
jgi:hypothetical protein